LGCESFLDEAGGELLEDCQSGVSLLRGRGKQGDWEADRLKNAVFTKGCNPMIYTMEVKVRVIGGEVSSKGLQFVLG
jgi:hypothetical protein